MRRRNLKEERPISSLPSLRNGRIPMTALVQTLAVAEYLSFYRAARALETSQSSVSARVKVFEEDLSVLLFQRNTRGVRLVRLAQDMIAAGELGEITSFRGVRAEDYIADSQVPWTWRFYPAGGGGAAADLNSHANALTGFLLSDITHGNADLETAIASRSVVLRTQLRRPY